MSTNKLSDYNTSGYVSKQNASSAIFSDLNLSMPIHPAKKDITPLTDIDSVKASLKNIVLTNFGEKLFRPFFGGNISSYLFENVDGFTAIAIRNDIERAIYRFEKRINDVKVQVSNDIDTNSYNVTIGFRIANVISTVDFNLERLR
jgi:phage baseplate assembly protein W